jgi:hypothetical protein
MATCVRIFDRAEFPFTQWSPAKNLDEVKAIFNTTNLPGKREVMAFIAGGSVLEINVWGESGRYKSLFADFDDYIVNEDGLPRIYKREDFNAKFVTRLGKNFLEGVGMEVNNLNKAMDAKSDAIEASLNKKKGCDGNCKCKKKNTPPETTTFHINESFDEDAFLAFIGPNAIWTIQYRFNNGNRFFDSINVYNHNMDGAVIKPGDTIIKLGKKYFHAPNTH